MIKPLTPPLSPMGRGSLISGPLSPMGRGSLISGPLSPMGRGSLISGPLSPMEVEKLFPDGSGDALADGESECATAALETD
jgi:hypothetical protein